MRTVRLLASWVPSLIVGMTLAGAAEVSAALLLYSGPGLLRALSLILAVEVGSAALGLWVAAGVEAPRVVEAIRRRWLFALITFSAAAVTSGVWAVLGGFSDSRLGQGLGLAVLGGLPLYAGGALAGLLGRPQAGLSPSAGSRWPGPAVVVVAGGALGFLVTGLILLGELAPASIFLGCIILLSAGALVHSRLVRPGPSVRTVEERSTALGEVRVEDRISRRDDRGVRVLRVNGRIRGAEDRHGRPVLSDEVEILRILRERRGRLSRALVLGAGAGTLVRELAALGPDLRVDAVEESPEVLSLARKHFPAAGDDEAERIRAVEGDPRGLGGLESGDYDVLLVDAVAVGSGRPAPLFSEDEARRVRGLLGEEGMLVIFRLPPREEAPEAVDALLGTVREWLPNAELRSGGGPAREEAALRGLGLEWSGASLVVASREPLEAPRPTVKRSERETDEST